jgi:IS5 family transposase
MYRKQKQQDALPEEFKLPFGGKLAADNRWVILAKMALLIWGMIFIY